jgi:hypothetical protein
VKFSAGGVSADDVIVALIASSPLAVPVLLVTDDGELRQRAEALGASATKLDPFVASAGWRS